LTLALPPSRPGADGSEQVKAETLLELRLKLEQKLTWMAKHFVGFDGQVLSSGPAKALRDLPAPSTTEAVGCRTGCRAR